MSGPKVVRVRTREERASECLLLIDGLRAAVDELMSFARMHDQLHLQPADRSKLISELTSSIDAGDFDEVLRRCRLEIGAVSGERQLLEKEVLRVATEAKSRRRRCQYHAISLANRMRRLGTPISPEIEKSERGEFAGDADLAAAEAAISRVLATMAATALHESGMSAMTPTQSRLASFLTETELSGALNTVVAHMPATSAIGRLDRAITEIETLDDTNFGNELLTRMRAVIDEPAGPEISMRIDSLLLEWSQRRTKLRQIADVRALAHRLAFMLERNSHAEATNMRSRLLSAQDEDLPEHVAQAQRLVNALEREANAKHRRKALLNGLAALGYEVGSELSSAWAKQGRVIVKKPDRPGYGVEVAGPADCSQLQVRVVAFADPQAPRDESRDRDAETMWCSEFGELQRIVSRDGDSVKIVRALGVGAVPVNRVDATDTEHAEESDLLANHTRALR